MPKVYENEIVFKYAAGAARALTGHSYPPGHTLNWLQRKYPNPYATHVHSVDTLSRTMDTETGVIRTERIIGVQQGAPKWITKVSAAGP